MTWYTCKICNKSFNDRPSHPRTCCSIACLSKFRTGKPHSEEHNRKIALAGIGRKHSEESKKKISQAHLGRKRPNMWWLKGENSACWKGDKASYQAIHAWVRNLLGSAKTCSKCGGTKSKRFEWANVSHEYKREESDWIQLCCTCHQEYDRNTHWGASNMLYEKEGSRKRIVNDKV